MDAAGDDPIVAHLRQVLHGSGAGAEQYCRLLRVPATRVSYRRERRLTLAVLAWRPGRATLRPPTPADADVLKEACAARRCDIAVLSVAGGGPSADAWLPVLSGAITAEGSWTTLAEAERGGTSLSLWIRSEHLSAVEGVRVGTFTMSHRGCAAVRLVMGGRRLCVASWALPPRTRRWKQRALCTHAALAATWHALGCPPAAAGADAAALPPPRPAPAGGGAAPPTPFPSSQHDAGDWGASALLACRGDAAAALAAHDYCIVSGALEARSAQGRDQLSEAVRRGAALPGFTDADTRASCLTSYFAPGGSRPDPSRVPGRTACVLCFAHEQRECRSRPPQVVAADGIPSRPLLHASELSFALVTADRLPEMAAELVREAEPDAYFALCDARAYLRLFYSRHNPQKVLEVDRVVAECEAQGAAVNEVVCAAHRRYGVTPQGHTADEALGALPKDEAHLRRAVEDECAEGARLLSAHSRLLRGAAMCAALGTADDSSCAPSDSSGEELQHPHSARVLGQVPPLRRGSATLDARRSSAAGSDRRSSTGAADQGAAEAARLLAEAREEEARRERSRLLSEQRLREQQRRELLEGLAAAGSSGEDAAAAGPAPAAFAPGDAVDGWWEDQPGKWSSGWYPGVVEARNADGSYNVLWSDGSASRRDTTGGLPASRLRPRRPSAADAPPRRPSASSSAGAPPTPSAAAAPAPPPPGAAKKPPPAPAPAPAPQQQQQQPDERRTAALSPGAQSLADRLLAEASASGFSEEELARFYPPSDQQSGYSDDDARYLRMADAVDLRALYADTSPSLPPASAGPQDEGGAASSAAAAAPPSTPPARRPPPPPRRRASSADAADGGGGGVWLPAYTLPAGFTLLWAVARERLGHHSAVDYAALCALYCPEYWTMLHERGRAMQRIRGEVRQREAAIRSASEVAEMRPRPIISRTAHRLSEMSPSRSGQGREFYDYTLKWLNRAAVKRRMLVEELSKEEKEKQEQRDRENPKMSQRSRQIIGEMHGKAAMDDQSQSSWGAASGVVYRHPVRDWHVHATEHHMRRNQEPPPCAPFEPIINDRSYGLADSRTGQSISERLAQEAVLQRERKEQLEKQAQPVYCPDTGQRLFSPNATPNVVVPSEGGKEKRVKYYEVRGPDGKPPQGLLVKKQKERDSAAKRPPEEIVEGLLKASEKSRTKFQRKVQKEWDKFMLTSFQPELSERTKQLFERGRLYVPVHRLPNKVGRKRLRPPDKTKEPKFGICSKPSVVAPEEPPKVFQGVRRTAEERDEYFKDLFKRLRESEQKHNNKMSKERDKKALAEVKECKFSPAVEEGSKRIFRKTAPRASPPARGPDRDWQRYEEASSLLGSGASPASSRQGRRRRQVQGQGEAEHEQSPPASWHSDSQPPPISASVSRSPLPQVCPREQQRRPTSGELRRPRAGQPAAVGAAVSPQRPWSPWQAAGCAGGGAGGAGGAVAADPCTPVLDESPVHQYYRPLTPAGLSAAPGGPAAADPPPQYFAPKQPAAHSDPSAAAMPLPRQHSATQASPHRRAAPSPAARLPVSVSPQPGSVTPQNGPRYASPQPPVSPAAHRHTRALSPAATVSRSSWAPSDAYDLIERHISSMYGVLSEYKNLEQFATAL
eukprot:TRINITY_DN1680_c0_g2_i3.p1 TRINITY_DN1680_c0_g2~~TRINITY_DN1680_c0_g2_i3.p1  ORF type:complete len:1652 (+),score=491.26 TRINITY_DN1680_c0_g2_i3:85-4956(+)